jgi:hypothetical protein
VWVVAFLPGIFLLTAKGAENAKSENICVLCASAVKNNSPVLCIDSIFAFYKT